MWLLTSSKNVMISGRLLVSSTHINWEHQGFLLFIIQSISCNISVRLCLFLSVSVYFCPFLFVSVNFFLFLFISVFFCMFLSLYVSLGLFLSVSVYFFPLSILISSRVGSKFKLWTATMNCLVLNSCHHIFIILYGRWNQPLSPIQQNSHNFWTNGMMQF